MELSPEGLRGFFEEVNPLLDERQRRLVAGAMARSPGRGGPTRVAEASGSSRSTVISGAKEMPAGAGPSDRVRAPGAGRRFLIDEQPGLFQDLDDLVEPEAHGDPMSPLRWTAKSTEALARSLVEKGLEERDGRLVAVAETQVTDEDVLGLIRSTMTELLVDTSVAMPLLLTSHQAHPSVTEWVPDRPVALAGHALHETYVCSRACLAPRPLRFAHAALVLVTVSRRSRRPARSAVAGWRRRPPPRW